MTDITELAAVLRLAAESEIAHRAEGDTSDLWQDEASPDNILALVEALEKAQTINAAAEKLVRCKGRYHSEQNYRALAALFGVTTPGLPPLDSESRTVTVKLASRRLPSDYADGEFGNDDLAAIHNACRLECKVSVEKYLSAHGIVVKWEAE